MPISSAPIDDGAVRIHEDKIVEVGRWEDLKTPDAEDLGEVILMPGLINAHCHLDYSSMRNAILYSGSFSKWVRRLNDLKRILTDQDYLDAIAKGFTELRRWGTTSVFNIESFPELMTRMPAPPLRTWWFYEMLDIRNRIHTEDVVAGALGFFDEHPKWLGGYGLSPHAPYTTSLSLYELSRICCEKYGMPLMTHLSETIEEYEMFTAASGQLYDFLAPLGRDMSDTGARTPLQHMLGNNALPHGAILTHMNYLSEKDWQLLADRAGDFTVAHCPNCHAYFERDPFDLERFRQIGVNLCLGTDSLASNKALNLFEEMHSVRRRHPSVPAQAIVEMVTINAGKAIGLPGRLGVLEPDAHADLIAVPAGEGDVYEQIIDHFRPINWMLVAGKPVA